MEILIISSIVLVIFIIYIIFSFWGVMENLLKEEGLPPGVGIGPKKSLIHLARDKNEDLNLFLGNPEREGEEWTGKFKLLVNPELYPELTWDKPSLLLSMEEFYEVLDLPEMTRELIIWAKRNGITLGEDFYGIIDEGNQYISDKCRFLYEAL